MKNGDENRSLFYILVYASICIVTSRLANEKYYHRTSTRAGAVNNCYIYHLYNIPYIYNLLNNSRHGIHSNVVHTLRGDVNR
jgi:hypothetical protein